MGFFFARHKASQPDGFRRGQNKWWQQMVANGRQWEMVNGGKWLTTTMGGVITGADLTPFFAPECIPWP